MCITYEKENMIVRPVECIYKYDNKFIFYSIEGKKIYEYDNNSMKCREIVDLMMEHYSWLFLTCMEIDKALYFIPYFATNMLRYHLDTGEVEKIPMRDASSEAKYHKVSYYKGKMFLFPFIGNDILVYDIDTKKKERCKFDIVKGKNDSPFFLNIYTHDYQVWSVNGKDSNIYCYNMMQYQSDVYKVKGNANSFIDITGNDDELFLLANDGLVIAWNIKNKTERIIKEVDRTIEEPYFAIRYFEDLLWLIPKKDSNVRTIDLQGNVIKQYSFSNLRKGNKELFEAAVKQNNILFLCPFYSNKIIAIDMRTFVDEIVEIEDINMNLIEKIEALMKVNVVNNKRRVGAYIWDQIKGY